MYIYSHPETGATRDSWLTNPSPLCSHAGDYFIDMLAHCSFLLSLYSLLLPRARPLLSFWLTAFSNHPCYILLFQQL